MSLHPTIRILAAIVAALGIVTGLTDQVWGQSAAAIYYVAPDGDDAKDGLAPERAWRSLERVNAATLKPGDQVLFRRGGQWRGTLLPQSGSEAAHVTYGAYGEGPKPAFLCSVAMNSEADWRPVGPNLWATAALVPSSKDVLPAKLFSRPSLHREQGAAAQGQSTKLGYIVRCERSGTSASHIQFYLAPFRIEGDKTYLLRFRAKSTKPFKLAAPHLMATGAPWGTYSVDPIRAVYTLGNDWVACTQLYRAAKTAADARLTFALGGRLPDGAELTIADLALVECEGTDRLPYDVGNIIFDHGPVCGFKKWEERDLKKDLDYWYDEDAHLVKLYSTENPAQRFQSIELALREHIIKQSGCSYVIYENLALRYGAAHGIGGGGTHHIIVRDCDFSWIGGGDQYGGERTVRFGNGVELWGNAHDCLVERCRLWEIYDAALTNQNVGSACQEYNLVYRHNVIWNCEYSFEYWNRPEESLSHHIYFEHNTCFGAGYGWGHAQRRDPAGRHLCFYTNSAKTHDIFIRNNIFAEATNVAFDALWWKPETMADKRVIHLDHNCWLQPSGEMIRLKGKAYTQAQFATYQRAIGQEAHSLVADPRFVDARKLDFRLRPDSPCIDAGALLGHSTDFDRHPIPFGKAPDLGAMEFLGR